MKWLLRILFILVAAVGLVIGALLLMPGDKLAAILAEQVKNETGRELKLSGDVKLSFWPVLGLEAGPVTFGNAPWAGSEPMLSAESLALGVDAAALLNGDLRIQRVVADNPVLRLELSDGRGNWELQPVEPKAGAGSEGSSPPEASQQGAVTLDQLELTNARLIYTENGATKFDFANVDLSASWPGPASPMVMAAQMAVPGGKVSVDLKIPDLPAFASGAVTPLQLALRAPGGEVGFNGRVNLAGEMDGALEVKTTNTEKMLAAFGQAGVGVPLGLGRVADVSGQMTYTSAGRFSLRNMVAQLDNNRFTGEADIEISDPPKVTARLNGGDIDLSRYNTAPAASGAGTGAGAGSTPRDGWSITPI
ncbi:MAG: AsmA family protein, partial [Ruegeria sp.]|nr:AsmA family protein [Ruegeria sp.]